MRYFKMMNNGELSALFHTTCSRRLEYYQERFKLIIVTEIGENKYKNLTGGGKGEGTDI
ncbi:hypothetical protein L8C07_14190 [Paenibacillus sp. CMAA1739]|uniref:hypothetical protein n=1 Tax=Paenibacillus ottowii TaxID=2315729 RepID=UPI00272EE929|nr:MULTISPECIES: hypothetical protein [Paenibacillus]MDP1509444.1 hypothetical protein [Paenibacillus ottowii]MEC4567095.1 hypothetical protein [Paenibacillus sp. CMAA1739]